MQCIFTYHSEAAQNVYCVFDPGGITQSGVVRGYDFVYSSIRPLMVSLCESVSFRPIYADLASSFKELCSLYSRSLFMK